MENPNVLVEVGCFDVPTRVVPHASIIVQGWWEGVCKDRKDLYWDRKCCEGCSDVALVVVVVVVVEGLQEEEEEEEEEEFWGCGCGGRRNCCVGTTGEGTTVILFGACRGSC